MRRIVPILLFLCATLPLSAESKSAQTEAPSILPVTTASAPARELFEKGMVNYENLHLDRATQDWRAAAKTDRKFALAHAWIAFNTNDPTEARSHRKRAKALASHVSAGEQLMIRWIVNVQEGNFVTGIAAMNDMLAMFPKDKRLLYLASNWLMGEGESDQAGKLCERALVIDPDYPAALNNLAYAKARTADFAPAFVAMQHYVRVLPHEPNPHDSYAEILRMSGNFKGALVHYRAALKVDPNFHASQLGLGDTYALMGNQARARTEYAKAIQRDRNEANRLNYALQSAMTWVRENQLAKADKAFQIIADKAHKDGLGLFEVRAHRLMAMYQADDAAALSHLEQAETGLSGREDISQADKAEEHARILRQRVARATHAGDEQLAAKTLFELEVMAKESRRTVIQQSYHAAEGTFLVAQKKYADAIANLQEDSDDPLSLALLSRAYGATGAEDDEQSTEKKLRAINTPTIEQAIVVVPARAKSPSN
jgi:tetratricopeptide (TPR) repeat protein